VSTNGRRWPYQGLVPYSEDDAEWFFGRDEWREVIADNLRAYRITVVYGESGVGKSSLLRAGVISTLRAETRLVPVTFSAWSLDDPLAALKKELGGAAGEPLVDVCRAAAGGDGTLLLVLDQLEELFVYHERGRDGAVEELSAALQRRDPAVHFLLSIREDALARLDSFEGHVPGLGDHLLPLEPLDREAAREAILAPLEHWRQTVGEEWEIEPALVDAVLEQVAAGQVSLGANGGGAKRGSGVEAPYLQLVLTRLWDEERRAGSHCLRLQTLERLGGADRIVRTHLDTALEALSEPEQDLSARVLRYLVTPSGTKIAHGTADLADYEQIPTDQLEPLVDRLVDERILRPAGDGRYEIYHDALAGPIADWQRRWQEQKRHRRELRRIAFVGSAALVLALVAAALVVLTLRARDAQHVSHSRELAAEATADLEVDPQESLQAAVRAAHAAPTAEAKAALRAALGEANLLTVLRGHDDAVYDSRYSPNGKLIVTASEDNTARIRDAASGRTLRLLEHPDTVYSAAFSRDGRRIVTADEDGVARVWDVRTGRVITAVGGRHSAIYDAAFSPDGRLVATAGGDRTGRIWSAGSGRIIAVLEGHGDEVEDVVFSPDGRLVATASSDSTARLWDARSGKPLAVLRGHSAGDAVTGVDFSPDGDRLVTASADGTASLWDTKTWGRVEDFVVRTGWVSVAFSPDGEHIVTAGEDGTASIWEIGNAQPIVTLRGHPRALTGASFSPDGARVVTSSYDETARIWQARQIFLRLPGRELTGVAFSPDGSLVVVARSDGTAGIWRTANGSRAAVVRTRHRRVLDAFFRPDGKVIVVTAGGRTVLVRDASSGRTLAVLRGHDAVNTAAFSRDGRRVVTGAADKTARVWDASSGRTLAVLVGHEGPVLAAAFSPDGSRVVTGDNGGYVRVWEAGSGKQIKAARVHESYLLDAAFSPDGKRVVTASGDQTARVWDARSRQALVVLRGHEGRVWSAAFSPDGELVVTGSIDGTVRIWDARTGKAYVVLRGDTGPVYSVAFSPQGDLVAASGRGGAWTAHCEVCGSLKELLSRARVQLARSPGRAASVAP
jgi:WD40 repeat protein